MRKSLHSGVDYSAAGVLVREDLRTSHEELLAFVGRPGAWWSGAERIAIAGESRGLASPAAVLSEPARDLARRVRNAPAALTREFFDAVVPDELSVGAYVELVGIVSLVAGLDAFCDALGAERLSLPAATPGEPDRVVPEGLSTGIAWVPILLPEDAQGPEADLYPDLPIIPHIAKALSFVPSVTRQLQQLSETHYFSVEALANPNLRRDLDRMQIELIAARVSALGECFY